MANRRLSMRKIKEVLRLKWGQKLSNRQIAKSCSISHSTVSDYLLRAELAGLSWPLDPKLNDVAIENLLFPLIKQPRSERGPAPNMEYLYREMKKRSVTLQLLWYEYKNCVKRDANRKICGKWDADRIVRNSIDQMVFVLMCNGLAPGSDRNPYVSEKNRAASPLRKR